ncbi:glycosyltransferase [Marinobacter xiaoshiensis]|uniref:Glycosyltransferase n=1 Tax=Marinobacter xiaoshiensis TaxID=3073652 RepID=A0ABU2HEI9_9GAMM|nr:glycosyltransferase [Marinobacter sp. F60267]MDS1309488.1 glycosyltransferase [Marinobacter sp. F60267]
MLRFKADIVIINRSFWPIYPVIGEALLQFAEKAANERRVGVILQDHVGIREKLHEAQRGSGVDFFPCKALTTSSSGIFLRMVDAVFFMLWVMGVLLWQRPRKVYVSTDPPILVPFIVMLYAQLFGARFVYHLQDIHPEAANVVIKLNTLLYSALRNLDCVTMRRADQLITITEEMAEEIRWRSGTQSALKVLANPAVSFDAVDFSDQRKPGFSFCGNAGRLQRIPLVIASISKYLDEGGTLEFAFAGAGVFSNELKALSERYSEVTYLGHVTPLEAAQVNAVYEWALLPIEDEVTRFAFPSKTSSYVFSGAKILAICGQKSSVAKWVTDKRLGVCVEPDVDEIVSMYQSIENSQLDETDFDMERSELKNTLGFDVFVEQLCSLMLTEVVIE